LYIKVNLTFIEVDVLFFLNFYNLKSNQ